MVYNKKLYLKYRKSYSDYNKMVYKNLIDNMTEDEFNAYKKNSAYKSKKYRENNLDKLHLSQHNYRLKNKDEIKNRNIKFRDLIKKYSQMRNDSRYLEKNGDIIILKIMKYRKYDEKI